MTFDCIIRCRRTRDAVRRGPLGPYIDGFTAAMAGRGYTEGSLRDVVRGAMHFVRYLVKQGITDLRTLRNHHVRDFVRTLPVFRRRNGYLMPTVRSSRGAHHLLRYLRASGITPAEPLVERPYTWLLEPWLAFLRQHRGLVPGTVAGYRHQVEPFLRDLQGDVRPDRFATLSPTRVRAYLERQAPHLARVTRKNLVITLRSFLGFAFSAGWLQRDLAATLERVPCFTLDRLPRGPKWEDLPALLETVDRSTPAGRRDFAILLLLLTYGVRAGQLVSLRLEDVHWRERRLTFPPAKRGRPIDVPLTPAVGEALLAYLRDGRPQSAARAILLTVCPPVRPLSAKSVYNVVVRAFGRAGIASPHGGSHAIRHAWATRAMAQGQQLKTIADCLGHRSLESTRIYTKVDYAQLCGVGLPWPRAVHS